MYLHIHTMTGKGRINTSTAQHVNLFKQYKNINHTTSPVKSLVCASMQLEPSSHNNLCLLHASGDQQPFFLGGKQEDDWDNDVIPNAINDAYANWEEGNFSNNDPATKEVKGTVQGKAPPHQDNEETGIIASNRASPGATPLAMNTVIARLHNILCHISLAGVTLQPNVGRDVCKIIHNLGQQRASIQLLSSRSAGSATILLLQSELASGMQLLTTSGQQVPTQSKTCSPFHTMVLFMDECRGHVTTWLDMQNCAPGQVGQYLQWGMVTLTLCGYNNSDNPEFVLNTSSISLKHHGRLGGKFFHINLMGTRKDQPKSEDPLFAIAALGILQLVWKFSESVSMARASSLAQAHLCSLPRRSLLTVLYSFTAGLAFVNRKETSFTTRTICNTLWTIQHGARTTRQCILRTSTERCK